MSSERIREVSFEIAGPMAMFTRPDTGATPTSYPVPTYSAVKGMFEAIARRRGAYIQPTHVEICNPIRYETYVTNYGGPLRKPLQIKKDNNYQLLATTLVDVRYRAFGAVLATGPNKDGINAAHALQEIFERRLQNGQCFYTPCLGWKEFMPSSFGPLRDGSGPNEELNLTIPSLLHSVFDSPTNGRVRPRFSHNVEVQGGVLLFDPGEDHAH
jgi:CRISPR-associated protein Cas5d